MANNKRKRKNRARWRSLISDLVSEGFMRGSREVVHMNIDEHTGQIHDPLPVHYQGSGPAATQPRSLLWELPKEDKAIVAKPCKECNRCTHCGAHHHVVDVPVVLSAEVMDKIEALMNEYDKHEWLAYFTSSNAEGIFDGLVIPNQEGKASTVDVDPGASEGIPIVGVIHSHVKMTAFHSGTDDDHLIANNPVSVVVSARTRHLEFDAVRTVKLDCGAIARYKTEVQYEADDATNTWIEEAKSKIRLASTAPLPPVTYSTYSPTGSYGYGVYCHRVQWCMRRNNHDGPCSKEKDPMPTVTEHPGIYMPGTVTRNFCTKISWCYRNNGHYGNCSQAKEEELCRREQKCMLKAGHAEKCNEYGGPDVIGITHGGGALWE